MLTPSSRLGDDLYRLYLAGLAWMLLPFYGALFNEVLPSEWTQFDDAFDIAVLVALGAGVWSGLRGGPLMVTRAVILHELGSPASKVRLLMPWLLRQAAAWAMGAAVVATVMIVLAAQDAFGYQVAFSTSIAAIFAAWSGVFLAAATMVASHQRGQTLRLGVPVAVIVALVAIAVLVGTPMRSGSGIAVLGFAAIASIVVAAIALRSAPIEPLWRRATAVESMRSALQQFQFQRVLLDLRNATEQPPFSTGRDFVSPSMPLGLWRHFAAVQHAIGWHLLRLAAFTGLLAALVGWGDLEQGVVSLGIAGCALLIGIEVSGAVAATADQMTFVLHYPKGSGRILRSQVATSVGLATLLGTVAVVSRIGSEPRACLGVVVISVAGAVGAAVQARLGSPDVAALLDKFGPAALSNALWARALLGPLLVLATTVAVYHQFLTAEPLADSLYVLVGLLIAAGFAVAINPLERAIQKGS